MTSFLCFLTVNTGILLEDTRSFHEYPDYEYAEERMEGREAEDEGPEVKLPEDNLRGFALMISKLLFRLAQI